MAEEAEGREVTEEVEAPGEDEGQTTELLEVGAAGEKGSPVTADSVVEAFFATDGGPESTGAGNGEGDEVTGQHHEDAGERSSDDDKEEEGQAAGADNDKAVGEPPAQPVDGDGNQPVTDSAEKPRDPQQAMAEPECDSEDFEKDDEKEEFSDTEPPQPQARTEQKRDSEDSAGEGGADGEGSQGTRESFSPRVAPPTTVSPTANSQGTDKDEEMESEDGKESKEDHTEEPRFELGSEQCYEPEDGNATGDVEDASDRQGVHVVAQDIVQHVLDRVMDTDRDIDGQHGEAGQETDTQGNFAELGKVAVDSEVWGSEGLARTGSGLDDASLSSDDASMDREKPQSEQPPEADGDERDVETGSDVGIQPCEGEKELQGESQQLYQYAGGRSPSPTSPSSQGDVRIQQGDSKQEHGSERRPSPKAEYPLNPDTYKVCRMLSPGVKECLILETGEQVVYDCSSRDCTVGPNLTASGPDSQRPSLVEKEKVKRNLFSDEARGALDKPSAPGPTPVSSAATPSDSTAPLTQSRTQHQIPRSAQDQFPSRGGPERPWEAEESRDGSYLWLQRQVQWRARSSEMPAKRSATETGKAERHVTSPSSGYQGSREERRGESGSRQDVSGEGRLGLGLSLSASNDVSGSVSSSGAIPSFNTLRDQQVSWLSMYRMLEEQHRSQLQAQYSEHQLMINDMQRHLEGRLLTQQQSMQQKLDNHREALKDAPSYPAYTRAQGISDYSRHSTQTQGHSDSLPLSDPPSPHQQREAYIKDTARIFQGGSSQRSFRDSARPSSPEPSREKRLRGGVYSSPMPTAKFRTTTRERSSYEADSQEPYTATTTSERRSQRLEEDDSDSRQFSAQTLSPRTHQSLREKHAKHLADLRSYYEAEIQDLRQKLSAEGLRPSSVAAAAARESARERRLQEENQMLRLQMRDVQDSLDDSQIYNRDLEQKLQGLEIRAADYAKRYEESQNTVLKLKSRLEELHSYAKDRESVLEQAQANEKRQAAALQEMYKVKEEQEETARREKSTIKRLLDKYENLEKDYSALSESSAQFEQSLFETRSEVVQLNKTISQLELENRRLTHDNDNMRHRLAVSGSLPLTRQELAESGQHRAGYQNLNGYTADSATYPQTGSARGVGSRDSTPPRRAMSEEDEAALGTSDSPLLRAERELRRLQQTLDNGEFIPRLQPKKYMGPGSLCPAGGKVTIIDALSSPTRSGSGMSVDSGLKEGVRRGKKTVGQPGKRERPTSAQGQQPGGGRSAQKSSLNGDAAQTASTISSPTRFDVGAPSTTARSPAACGGAGGKKGKGRDGAEEKRDGKSVLSGNSACRVDATLERIRSGELVSRPQWEDVYTSLAKPAQPSKVSSLNMTQDEMLRDRIRSIDEIEKRYDALQVEKRKLESQLNKVPAHGRDRKSRREKELLEERLDSVDHELGSLRMTLKRYQVLKTTM